MQSKLLVVLGVLVFQCPSVCLAGRRSNYTRKVPFCFVLFALFGFAFLPLQSGRQESGAGVGCHVQVCLLLRFCIFEVARVRWTEV